MNRITKLLLTSLLVSITFFPNAIIGQNSDYAALKNEFPLLMDRYGDRLESRSAHYVFAIDISSSMLVYEQVVKRSLEKFIDAVPDGDQISIIVMSDENTTGYLDAAKCITINGNLRQDLKQIIHSNGFTFKHQGDPSDGSDGFTMTKKVLDAMNVVNSSDLTFVYLLTDFEYWTHRYHYQKDMEDWASLKSQLTNKHKDMMCKYGIELTFNSVNHPEALFNNELDNIFGPLDYQTAASAEMLSQWFGHIINDIQAHKINAMLKADWKEYLENCNITLHNEGRELEAVINAPDCDLVNGIVVTMGDGCQLLTPAKEIEAIKDGDTIWRVCVGNYESKPTLFPSNLRISESDAMVNVTFDSPYSKEINKLQGLCQENEKSIDAVRLNQEYTINAPEVKIWNAVFPLWVYILALLLIVGILASIAYTICIHPEKRYTSIVVRRRSGTTSQLYDGETTKLPIAVGNSGDVNVPNATWTLKIFAKKYNPILTWLTFNKKKTGYYAMLVSGDYADIINDYTDQKIGTLSTGKQAFLFPFKKASNCRIEITESTIVNRIEIG